ncbi:MAG: hypothetical protein ACOZNI_14980 [Myxococcota bacterium]
MLRPFLVAGDSAPSLCVADVYGREVHLGEGPLAVVFTRPGACPLGRQALAELRDLRLPIPLVVVTPDVTVAPGLAVVPDVAGTIARAFGVGHDALGFCTLRAPGLLARRRTRAALRRGGSVLSRTLGAEFVVSAGHTIAYVRYCCSIVDGPDVRGLSAAVAARAGMDCRVATRP